MKVEEQLERLAALGIRLEPGVTVDYLTSELDRQTLEERPFEILLNMFGGCLPEGDWDQPICARAWGFDTECIDADGDYVKIVRNLLRVAGKPPDYFKDIKDRVDFDEGEAWLEYTLPDGERAHWDVELNDDWVDAMVVNYVMGDIESDGFHFYNRDNGQAMTLFYLDDATAAAIEELAPGVIERVLVDV